MNTKHRLRGFYLPSLLCIFALAVSCDEDEALGAFTPPTPVVEVDGNEIAVDKDAGEYEVAVESNLPWRASTETAWIELTEFRGLESGKLKFKVARNSITEPREGQIRLWITDDSEVVLRVVQAMGDLPPDTKTHVYVKANGTGDGSSWEQATSLADALAMDLFDGDFIHVAAGTHAPAYTVSGGSAADEKDLTFEIKQNLNIIGGYPADAAEGAVADPAINETILTGVLTSGGSANHVVTISAPRASGKKVVLHGLTIRDGDASTSGNITINGVSYPKNHGGGVIVAQSDVEIIQCIVSNNKATAHGVGMYVFSGASVLLERSAIRSNTGAVSNGGGMYLNGASATFIDSSVDNNTTDGVAGGIQTFGSSELRMYNTTIANNISGALGSAGRRAGGIYHRDNSKAVLVNCTVYGNSATGLGGGIHTHGGSTIDIISSAITANNGDGGGLNNTAGCTMNIYNTIVSGNVKDGAPSDVVGDVGRRQSVVGTEVTDADGAVVGGASFDAATMLGALADNGGHTESVVLQGDNNPAVDNGMTATELSAVGNSLSLAVPEEVTSVDQTGASRADKKTIGAVVK